jgi:molybdopterin converting factor small subunit
MFDILYKTIKETTQQIMEESNLEEVIRNKYKELSKTKEFENMVTNAVRNEMKLSLERMIEDDDEIYLDVEEIVKMVERKSIKELKEKVK